MRDIVVIDSDLERRDFFYDILMQLNCTVTTLPYTTELLEVLKKERPDCIIIDVGAVDDSIESTLKKIYRIDHNIKVILLMSDEDRTKLQGQLTDNAKTICLQREVKPKDLIPAVLKLLREKEREDGEGDFLVAFRGGLLIVDDEEDAAFFLKEYMDRKGYSVDTASNGEEALLKVRSNKVKVVVLDVMMPGMDGLLVLKHIKEIDDNIVVIVGSGTTDKRVVDEALRLGAARFLEKPFSLEELEAAILMSLSEK